ncbi:NAD(P)/FAD-dependent oxidoreductase [Lutimonas saemankumensis]|uniref:NAD(P)/FAD-dependent oxidoreductase n=1 Tax=Lutimonas saemankumensis TaxID=483016 RepID=UPI001CD4B163|nr:NAD(P)/FAD-dependent oxidoreductase [Lutimonas saemankumensis]MCA0932200.1 NAD(P)/FAD-dependent oxidoreductase [Lutimonas saemankumensis]
MSSFKVVIVGGGLAGLTASLHLSKYGIQSLLVEKEEYPRHKVCGEYISNEVLPYLISLGMDPFSYGAKKMEHFELSAVTGDSCMSDLPLGGFSLSRYTLDAALYEILKQKEIILLHDTVTDIKFHGDLFRLELKDKGTVKAKFVLGAYGKRSSLDTKLKRRFMNSSAPYLAVKAHYKGDYPDNVVGLHNFYGGYCGVSKIENGALNICYIVSYEEFKKYRNIEEFEEKVLFKNKFLKNILLNAQMLFDKPLAISQISFESKSLIEDHVIMCGDAAGMIHPLCGNGMSMAILSARMISDLLVEYFNAKSMTREQLEKKYRVLWKKAFSSRLRTGRVLSRLFEYKQLSLFVINYLKSYPAVIEQIIKRTHGKPVESL